VPHRIRVYTEKKKKKNNINLMNEVSLAVTLSKAKGVQGEPVLLGGRRRPCLRNPGEVGKELLLI